MRIPSHLVRRALALAPRSFTLFARDGNPKHDIHIGPGRAHFGPGPTCPNFIDVETLERRPYVRSDVPLVAKVVDALPNIDFCESLGTVGDVHHELGALYEFAGMFPHTSKPIVAWSYDRFELGRHPRDRRGRSRRPDGVRAAPHLRALLRAAVAAGEHL